MKSTFEKYADIIYLNTHFLTHEQAEHFSKHLFEKCIHPNKAIYYFRAILKPEVFSLAYANRQFELFMSAEYESYSCFDEWGSAMLFDEKNGIGAEYNYCVEPSQNSCAFYFMKRNDDGYYESDHDDFEHYEIDFNRSDWKLQLELAMNRFVDYHLPKE